MRAASRLLTWTTKIQGKRVLVRCRVYRKFRQSQLLSIFRDPSPIVVWRYTRIRQHPIASHSIYGSAFSHQCPNLAHPSARHAGTGRAFPPFLCDSRILYHNQHNVNKNVEYHNRPSSLRASPAFDSVPLTIRGEWRMRIGNGHERGINGAETGERYADEGIMSWKGDITREMAY